MTAIIKTAMVLAAGLGTRMRPLTDDRPKPMIEVGGKYLIDWVLDDLADAGLAEVIINLHYKAEMMTSYLTDREQPSILFSDETDVLLDTGGGVAHALPLFDDTALIVTNSDALWRGGLAKGIETLSQTWSPDTHDALLLLAPMGRAFGFDGAGDFFLTEDGVPERRGNRSAAPYVYSGTQIVNRRLLDGCPDGPFSFNVLWDLALAQGRCGAVVQDDDWFHVGTPDAVDATSTTLMQPRSDT